MAIVTYNDNGTIKVVKFGNYVVSTDADPAVQKQWVFLNGTTSPEKQTFESTGVQESDYAYQGCAAPSTLASILDSQYPASGLGIGARAAVRMNQPGGDCDTWALFEVQAV